MRVGIVSTYPPRSCGIGMFSQDLRAALVEAEPSIDVEIAAMVTEDAGARQPEVVADIQQDVRSDYAAAARTFASRGTDVVLIEHEFGIFGGEAGSFVLSLAEELLQPYVVTLHTVLAEPSDQQLAALSALCQRATLVTVFTDTARRMVVDAGLASPKRIRVVPHGAPALLRGWQRQVNAVQTAEELAAHRPALERLDGRTVLSTFGLISSGKGIEVAIQALPAIVQRHPDVIYLVAGRTHPEVVKAEGERYRLLLERLVRDLGLTDHVHFIDRFLSVEELAVLLSTTDLYVTPYRSHEQIVSGALTFAVVAGCPVVSTPYLYAEDLLASGAGVLVPAHNPSALAERVIALLDDRAELATMATEAARVGSQLTWPAVGAQLLKVLDEAAELGPAGVRDGAEPVSSAPRIRSDHLLTLVDDVGIVQHAHGLIPNRSSGYCADDAARLVVVAAGLDRNRSDPSFHRMLTLGLSFLSYAWDPSIPGMHNFMAYDRHWLDSPHEGDHVGRAAWALGETVAAARSPAVSDTSLRMLRDLAPMLQDSLSPRCVAYAVLGLTRPAHLPEPVVDVLHTLAKRLFDWYAGVQSADWRWFEDELTYDNARLPQALIAAGYQLDEESWVTAGLQALDWYSALCGLDSGVVILVGNRWRHRAEPDTRESGDEQPLDATALVDACLEAYRVTARREYAHRALRAFEWFLGRNRLSLPVYDFATGGCHDGLGAETLNDNEGAESTLSYLQALLALDHAGLQASLPRQ